MLMQSDQKFEKNRPIFGNVAKTVAKLQKLQLTVKNRCIKILLNVKISTTNCVLKLLIQVKFKNTQVKSSQMIKICPIWSPCQLMTYFGNVGILLNRK